MTSEGGDDSLHGFHDAQEEHDDDLSHLHEDSFESLDNSPETSDCESIENCNLPPEMLFRNDCPPESPSSSDQATLEESGTSSQGEDVIVAPDESTRETTASVPARHESETASTEASDVQQPSCDPGSKEYEERIEKAEALKQAGNTHFKAGLHEEALGEYAAALSTAPESAQERAVYHANSAACHMALNRFPECVKCCSNALLLDATYLKAIRRRMSGYEAMDQLDLALADAKKILEQTPTDAATLQNVRKWEPIVEERQAKMKEEVIGKLKDLGNNILGNFGMSCDNFKMVQDPSTGGYSFNFQK